jgi:hypothetical protein
MTQTVRFASTTILFANAVCCLQGQIATQNAIALAGAGYNTPRGAQAVAPGQLLVISLFGIKTNIPTPQITTAGPQGRPNSIDGVTVGLVQGNPPVTTPVEVRAIQQAQCPDPAACSPVTSLTVQIPFSLDTNVPFPELRISEQGTPVGGIILQHVSDSVHVLNTCDTTQIYISAADSVPHDVCFPVVLDRGKLISLYNLAQAGDEAAMWLYGLGSITDTTGPCCSGPDQLSKPINQFQLNFDFRPNAPASPAVAGFGVTAAPLFAAYVGAGTYQINFTVPPIPAGTPPCDGTVVTSNLTITASGPNSFDAARVCVSP